MGQSLSLCQSCSVDVKTDIDTINREQERVNREVERLRQNISDINELVSQNLLTVCLRISELKVTLATMNNDIQHIKNEVDRNRN